MMSIDGEEVGPRAAPRAGEIVGQEADREEGPGSRQAEPVEKLEEGQEQQHQA